MGEGRKISKARRSSSNLACPGWPGAAPKSAWSQEGRVREPSLQALLRELAAFNTGLCVITTRTPVADIADHERSSALRCNLEQLSNDAGAKLLRALGVKGQEAELRSASAEFSGHCLALTLLGSYLTDAYNGDIRAKMQRDLARVNAERSLRFTSGIVVMACWIMLIGCIRRSCVLTPPTEKRVVRSLASTG